MTKQFIYHFIRQHTLAVIATSYPANTPEAALIGIAATPQLEIVFDTVKSSRKYQNMVQNPRVALVIGWDNETTLQLEGVAVELSGKDDAIYREAYFAVFPAGRQRAESWPGLVHFKITPHWLRYSNFNEPQMIKEMRF
ncbi:MAG TPA: pyridoxamine 5'-phosphate oxidase family protein [Chitinophagaceae bacterium]|nr:pyridoxamine 5'-phosphate oxidase family protein [Chitinophagaceae bacterium]